MTSDIKPAGRLNQFLNTVRPTTMGNVTLEDLIAELLSRIRQDTFTNETTTLLGCQLQDALRKALDIHLNRMSRKHHRDLFGFLEVLLYHTHFNIEGATVVDLGCGSINPYGLLFLFLMVGAGRGIAVDLDEIQNLPRAIQALGDCVSMMLVDPKGLVGEYPITREQVLRNVASFDLAQLYAGDPLGLDPARLSYRRESVYTLSFAEGEADLVISNAFFEHIPRIEEAIVELARITRKGGFHVHNIDGSDHRRYWDPQFHPLGFLTEASNEALKHGSNRIRPHDFIPLFERHGFELIAFTPFESVDVGVELREQFVEPFRSMPDEVLRVIGSTLLLRRT